MGPGTVTPQPSFLPPCPQPPSLPSSFLQAAAGEPHPPSGLVFPGPGPGGGKFSGVHSGNKALLRPEVGLGSWSLLGAPEQQAGAGQAWEPAPSSDNGHLRAWPSSPASLEFRPAPGNFHALSYLRKPRLWQQGPWGSRQQERSLARWGARRGQQSQGPGGQPSLGTGDTHLLHGSLGWPWTPNAPR